MWGMFDEFVVTGNGRALYTYTVILILMLHMAVAFTYKDIFVMKLHFCYTAAWSRFFDAFGRLASSSFPNSLYFAPKILFW
jgi:hypothetical protein